MTNAERGAGQPSSSLSLQNYSVAYGQAQFMSETGKPAASGWFGPLAPRSAFVMMAAFFKT